MAKSGSKPIFGFGLIGWIALAILLALIAIAIGSRDLQWVYLQLVGAVIGDAEVVHYVARFHVWHALSLRYQPGFNLIAMIPVVIALRIHPGRFGWWRYTLIVGWALFHPVYWITKPLLSTLADWLQASTPIMTFPRSWSAAEGLVELVTVVVLLIVTRSWRLSLVIAGLILCTTVVTVLMQPPGSMSARSPLFVVVTWQLAAAAIALTWAIRARITLVEEGHCLACGYDLTDLASGRCPECGLMRSGGSLKSEPLTSVAQQSAAD